MKNSRVGHSVLLRSERTVLFRSFFERNVLFRSFSNFWRLMKPPQKIILIKMNGNERKWTFCSFFERFVRFSSFRRLMKPLLTPKKAKKNSKIERNVQKMNETFFLQRKNDCRERKVHFHWTEMNVENETFISTERNWT